jgi:hypothetical protein
VVFRVVSVGAQEVENTVSMEGMSARENVEFPFKNRNVAQITDLARTDSNVLVSLTPLFSPKTLGILRVVLDLLSESTDFLFIVFETPAEMGLHLFYFGFSREQI